MIARFVATACAVALAATPAIMLWAYVEQSLVAIR